MSTKISTAVDVTDGASSLLAQSCVARLDWSDPKAPSAISRGEPVVLTNCPLIRKCAGWSFAHLSRQFEGSERLNVHIASASASKSLTSNFERVYASGLNSDNVSAVEQMSFAEFAAAIKTEINMATHSSDEQPAARQSVRRYCSAQLLKGRPGAEPSTPLRDSFECCHAGTIEDELREAIDWEWLDAAQACLQPKSEHSSRSFIFTSCNVWAGAGGGSTPLHFDALHNFLAQAIGRKRVLLFAPSESWKLYPYPTVHPKNSYAMVDLRRAEAEAAGRFPALQRARGIEASLEAGDVLFLPRYYWRFVSEDAQRTHIERTD